MEVVARALDCLVLQGGSLVVHDAVAHAELAVVWLLHILMLVGLLMLLQVRLELVLMLRQRQDHHAGDVARRRPQGQVCGDDWGAYWRHVLRAGVDEVLVPLPLPASPARFATRLHGRGFRRGQGGEVQVVLVCLNQHLCVGRQSPIVHQRGEDGLGVTVFGLSLKQPRQLGDTVHGSAAGVEVVGVFLLAAGHLDVTPPVVAHAVNDDAREDGTHGEGQNDGDGQQGHGNQLVAPLLVALTDHTCKERRRRLSGGQKERWRCDGAAEGSQAAEVIPLIRTKIEKNIESQQLKDIFQVK